MSHTSKLTSNGRERLLVIVGNVNGNRTEVETGMNFSCRSIGLILLLIDDVI